MNVLRLSQLIEQGRIHGQRVFIRADLNVPQDESGRITEETRIRASLPCIEMALKAGAAVMVTSHLGRPVEGQFTPRDSLAPVALRLSQLLGRAVPLLAQWVDGVTVAPGEVVLLENCRLNRGEKKNDETLARKMAALCDVFVHDAFGTAHRAEASTYGIAQFAKVACAGPLLAAEIDALTRALGAPRRPLVAIVAGSKVSTKLSILKALAAKVDQLIVGGGIAKFAKIACAGPLLSAELDALGAALKTPKRPMVAIVAGSKVSSKLTILKSLAEKVDQLVVGGGIANTFLLAKEFPIGRSLAEIDLANEAKAIIDMMAARGAAVPIPTDVVVATEFSAMARANTVAVDAVQPDDLILDIGPHTAAALAAIVAQAGTVVWNGPMGVFEYEQFGGGTRVLAEAIARSSAFSIAGGGDTLAAIAKYGIEKDIDYISTGGGAFLEVLEGKTLPAFAILEQRAAG